MKLYFICACTIVFTVCNFTPSQAVSKCATPSKYSSFQALVSGTCNAKQWVLLNGGSRCKECMYVDLQGRKAIGFDFNLEETDAKAILTHFGADYDKIVNGAPTDFTMPCDCNTVTCLNQSQIEDIFDERIAEAIGNAKRVLPSFGSLCCTVQKTVVDIAFAVGNSTFSTYTQFFDWLEHQNWQAASDYLRATKWCQVEAVTRCNSDADNIQYHGCPCFGQFPNKCYQAVSSCCQKGQSCCNATVTIKSDYKNETRQELLCCKYPNGYCCEENKCCPAGYPVCCLPNYCCGVNDLCSDGKCYNPSGKPSESVPAELIFPKVV